jgi:hypothetical protein
MVIVQIAGSRGIAVGLLRTLDVNTDARSCLSVEYLDFQKGNGCCQWSFNHLEQLAQSHLSSRHFFKATASIEEGFHHLSAAFEDFPISDSQKSWNLAVRSEARSRSRAPITRDAGVDVEVKLCMARLQTRFSDGDRMGFIVGSKSHALNLRITNGNSANKSGNVSFETNEKANDHHACFQIFPRDVESETRIVQEKSQRHKRVMNKIDGILRRPCRNVGCEMGQTRPEFLNVPLVMLSFTKLTQDDVLEAAVLLTVRTSQTYCIGYVQVGKSIKPRQRGAWLRDFMASHEVKREETWSFFTASVNEQNSAHLLQNVRTGEFVKHDYAKEQYVKHLSMVQEEEATELFMSAKPLDHEGAEKEREAFRLWSEHGEGVAADIGTWISPTGASFDRQARYHLAWFFLPLNSFINPASS